MVKMREIDVTGRGIGCDGNDGRVCRERATVKFDDGPDGLFANFYCEKHANEMREDWKSSIGDVS